ncbi:hypothetical protein ACFX2H_019767 [Malus domestica]
MDSSSESYFSTAKSTISSLFGFVLWASSRLPLSPMQSPKGFTTHQCLQLELGLKTLIFPELADKTASRNLDHYHPHIVHSFMVSSSISSSSSSSRWQPSSIFLDSTTSWSSAAMDDLIGTDSGVQIMLRPEQNKLWVENTAGSSTFSTHIKRRRIGTDQIRDRRKKEYPPPIPLLVQTRNLTSRMPWSLTRHCYNGRLVLKGEKVKHQEYFEALRENGRLVINLVHLHDYHFNDDVKSEENEELEMEEGLQFSEEVDAGEIKAERLDDDGDDDDYEDDDESGNNVEKAMALAAYNSVPQSHLGMTSRSMRHQNLSKHFKSEGAMVNLVESSSVVSLGNESDPNIPQDTNTYFAHPDSAPLLPLIVSVM